MRFISASSLASPFAFLFLESSNLLYLIPMATDLETRAKEAFIDNHFELAVDLYSQTIAMNPKNAKLFADRAQLEEYQTAKAALETCVSLAPGDSRFSNLIKECEVCIAAGELPVQSVDEAPTDVMIPPASQPLDKTASQSLDESDVASNDA